jgi:hypothetical protein
MKRIFISLLLALIMLVSIAFPVFAAVDHPDSLTLIGCWAFQNLAETGDMIFLYYYDAYYLAGVPVEIASDTLIIRLMDGITEIDHALPYPYYSNGYQEGASAIYFTAAQVTALGLHNHPYTATIEPNPLTVWVAPAPVASPCAIEWDTATTSTQAKTNFGNTVLAVALLLKTNWGVNMVDTQGGLNYFLTTGALSGQEYFEAIIPNLRSLCPQILKIQVSQPIYKTDLPTFTYAPDELPVDITATATIFGMSKGVMTSLIAMVALVAFSFFLISRAPFMARHILFIDGIIALFYTRIGALVPVWATIIGAASLLIIGYMIFYERSSA